MTAPMVPILSGGSSPGASADGDPYGAARRRGKRAANAFIVGLAVLFVGSSAWQLVGTLFLGGPSAATPSRSESVGAACADGLRGLASAVDRAGGAAIAWPVGATVPPVEDVVSLFRHGLSPEWDRAQAVETSCAASESGKDAWATLARLRSAEEELVREGHAGLGPLRRDLAAHLTAELR
jgi:hypothetical protein